MTRFIELENLDKDESIKKYLINVGDIVYVKVHENYCEVVIRSITYHTPDELHITSPAQCYVTISVRETSEEIIRLIKSRK